MSIERIEDFYAACAADRTYAAAEPKRKHQRQFDEQVWRPASCSANLSFLELGCGTGLFLAYLRQRRVDNFLGIDSEPRVLEYMPKDLHGHVRIAGIQTALDGELSGRCFDRIILLDVFEHFSPVEGVGLLERLQRHLAQDGRIVLRLPNAASPFGLKHHFGDVTHKAAYTPDSLRQVAYAAGFAPPHCLPVYQRTGWRRALQRLSEGVAACLFGDAPSIWTARFIAVLTPRPSPAQATGRN